MKDIDLAIAVLSFVVIMLGLFYKKLKTSLINETILATYIGIVISPFVLNILDVASWGSTADIMERICRFTFAMALISTAFRIPDKYLASNYRAQLVLLFLVMPGMLLCSSLIIHYVAGINWLLSLLIGAIISPTDPVLAGAIVTGQNAERNLSARIRHTISFESGANDGLAFPFVMLVMLLIIHGVTASPLLKLYGKMKQRVGDFMLKTRYQ